MRIYQIVRSRVVCRVTRFADRCAGGAVSAAATAWLLCYACVYTESGAAVAAGAMLVTTAFAAGCVILRDHRVDS